MRKVLLDTNVYVDWLNRGHREPLLVGPGLVRYLSAVVYMELRAGASTPSARRALLQLVAGYQRGGRLVAPSQAIFERAGQLLPALKARGRDVRKASLVNDVLIALTARSLGATLVTADTDFEDLQPLLDFSLEIA